MTEFLLYGPRLGVICLGLLVLALIADYLWRGRGE